MRERGPRELSDAEIAEAFSEEGMRCWYQRREFRLNRRLRAQQMTVRDLRDELLIADLGSLGFHPFRYGQRITAIETYLRPLDYLVAPLGRGR